MLTGPNPAYFLVTGDNENMMQPVLCETDQVKMNEF